MKKLLIGQLNAGLVLVLLAVCSSCPITDPVIDGNNNDNGSPVISSRVGTPIIQRSPGRVYNNAPIRITLICSTPDAHIYYTIDWSSPEGPDALLYDEPFSLDFSSTNDPRRGFIKVQAIAKKEGLADSLLALQEFQVFETEPFGEFSGNLHGSGTGYNQGLLGVSLTLVDGFITEVAIENGYNGTAKESEGYWIPAHDHGIHFLKLMNHWDFDTRTSATYSSIAIRNAAREALEKLP